MPPNNEKDNIHRKYGPSSSTSASSSSSSTGHSQVSSRQQTPVTRQSIVNEDTPMFGTNNTPRNYQSTENPTTPGNNVSQNRHSHQQDASQEHLERERTVSPPPHDASWYQRVADKYGSIELENKGSVARDHLALERTFLSWLRTSLAFASIGIAITQLFRLNTSVHSSPSQSENPPLVYSDDYIPSSDNKYYTVSEGDQRIRSLGKPLGATFIGIAIVVLTIGFHRYFESQYWVIRGKFPASRGSVAIVAFITGSMMISSLVVILTIASGGTEK